MWLFIWNLIAMIGVLLIVFPVAAIHDYEERNKLNRKKLKIYLLLMIVPGIMLMIISTCGLGIFDRLIIGALCLSPLLLIGLINLFRLFKKYKKQESDEDYFIFT